MDLTVVGDVHGRVEDFSLHYGDTWTVQLGDWGFHTDWSYLNSGACGPYTRIIPGNHDAHPDCLASPYSLGNFGRQDLLGGIYTVRGAYSLDKAFRTEGVSWWSREELSIKEADEFLTDYEKERPDILMSHDCPMSIVYRRYAHKAHETWTNKFLEEALRIHRPKVWIFGHHHVWMDFILQGTRFICVPELKSIQINTSSLEIKK